jgi:hypothetical protein
MKEADNPYRFYKLFTGSYLWVCVIRSKLLKEIFLVHNTLKAVLCNENFLLETAFSYFIGQSASG